MALSKIDTTNMIEDVPQSKLDNNINFRNIIINGGMDLAQRGTSSTGLTTGGYRTVDRFNFGIATAGTWTITQDSTVPTGQGFAKSTKLDCTTANASLSAGSELTFFQKIEGQNLQYLKKGTSNAESVTLSFWVRSNKTGTYTAEIFDNDNSRQISKTYTISSADTWEKKTITFAGDTTGALDNDNAVSFWIFFWLGAGSNYTSGTLNTSWNSSTTANRVSSSQVNLADSTSNEFYITGVQLEAGEVASDFEFLPQPVMKNLCHRYCYVPTNEGSSGDGYVFAWGYCSTSSQGIYFMPLPTLMRSQPTLVLKNTSNALEQGYHNATVTQHNTNVVTRSGTISSDKNLLLVVSGASFNAGQGTHLRFARQDTDETSFVVDAEL